MLAPGLEIGVNRLGSEPWELPTNDTGIEEALGALGIANKGSASLDEGQMILMSFVGGDDNTKKFCE